MSPPFFNARCFIYLARAPVHCVQSKIEKSFWVTHLNRGIEANESFKTSSTAARDVIMARNIYAVQLDVIVVRNMVGHVAANLLWAVREVLLLYQ